MKMIAIMCLEHCSKQVRKIFKDFEVSVFSELDVRGYSSDKTSQIGWWPGDHEQPNYSSLCFAIITKEKAEEIMDAIEKMSKDNDSDYPVRAFLMDVERMI
jgi:nitrogen regulatory protein PII